MTERPITGEWPAPAATASADWPSVPGYEILGELGRGGMGVVYKARDIESQRLVALKLIRDGALAGPQERARFRIEAEAAARIRHSNVVQIYDVGESQGLPYFAMELVEGKSLDGHLDGQPLAAEPAAQLVRTLAEAVEHAHAQKIVHRDLKPANILLEVRGQESGVRSQHAELTSDSCLLTPKITDFGLAKRLDSESTAWTQDGAVLGTASYMAPEQAAGRTHEIGPAVDIYALGAMLYELLTGRPPFRAASWNETINQVLHDEPTPPTRLQAGVPTNLETVCLKCLEKEPSRRYASAADLADDLSRFLDGQPVMAVAVSAEERLARLAARDGYQIVGEIGRGPRSVVYRALHGPLQQPVALKVFESGLCAREEWETRLQRGIQQWAALAHPQVILPQRTGWWADAPYLAVEYVPHGSLAAQLTGRPHPLRSALRLVEQLADIVCYLHRQGIVHGNLKPSNVLLAADGIPRVIDLRPTGGLARGALPDDDRTTADLCYLPPELVADPSAEPRPYTDVYGLGLILYELLTGRPPFAGTTARETLDDVRARDPIPPSYLNSAVPPVLDLFCLRCLRKNPWHRFSRAYYVQSRVRYFRENSASGQIGDERWPQRNERGTKRGSRPPPR
jgi:serine/threonine protein kinase